MNVGDAVEYIDYFSNYLTLLGKGTITNIDGDMAEVNFEDDPIFGEASTEHVPLSTLFPIGETDRRNANKGS